MKRRTFLSRLGTAAIALTLARHLPGIAPMPMAVPAPPVVEAVLQRGDVFTIAGQYEHIWLTAGRVLGDVPDE